MLIQMYWSSCIEKIELIRNLCSMLCVSSSGISMALCVQEKLGKLKGK